MSEQHRFHENVIRFAAPTSVYWLLRSSDGHHLCCTEIEGLDTQKHTDNSACWIATDDCRTYRHATTGLVLSSVPSRGGIVLKSDGHWIGRDGGPAEEPAVFSAIPGPADLPSAYLDHIEEHGWVCIPGIIGADIVQQLDQISLSCTGGSGAFKNDHDVLLKTSAVAKASVEPVSLWLIRQYLKTQDICMATPPALSVIPTDDGQEDVLGWHSDYPYSLGILDSIPPGSQGTPAMAVQRILCVSPFTQLNGATCFKLGSYKTPHAIPKDWGIARDYFVRGHRATHGLPYSGLSVDVIEAPAGSFIIFDARTWHRPGINLTDSHRIAMLQAIVPFYIKPIMDVTECYKSLLRGSILAELSQLQRTELEALCIHTTGSPNGVVAIGVDYELSHQLGLQ